MPDIPSQSTVSAAANDEFITLPEVCQVLGIRPATLRSYIRRQKVIEPDKRITPRCMLWVRSRFFTWLAGQAAGKVVAHGAV